MTFKVGTSGGHGGKGSTAGKRTPDNEYEWNFNDKNVKAFIDELQKYEGVEVRRFDDASGNTDVPLDRRIKQANDWGADVYIDFHHNANTGHWGTWTGTETFTYLGANPGSERLAELVHPKVVQAYGLRDRGLKKANFYVLRVTKMPAILIEGGYMDSSIDIKKLRDDSVLEKAGRGAAVGVAQYGNLTRKPEVVVVQISNNHAHVVKAKDTLWGISRLYGVKVSDIRNWNNLKSDSISIGDRILVKEDCESKPITAPKLVAKKVAPIKKSVVKKAVPVKKPVLKHPKFVLANATLKYGSRGVNVTRLQITLNAANFKLKGKVDGRFGPDTLQALKRFQSIHTPKDVDGIYGPSTKSALSKVLN